MNDYSQVADKCFNRAVRLAKGKPSLQRQEDIATALYHAYDFYRWARFFQHAAAIKSMLEEDIR